MISLSYIIKELLAEKTRLFLTILAIAWGTASIAVMLAVGEGLRINFGDAMKGAGDSILAIQGGETSIVFKGQEINQKVRLTLQDEQALSGALKNIDVTTEYTFVAELKTEQAQKETQVSAVFADYAEIRNISIAAGGRFINDLDNQQQRNVIVIGNELRKEFFEDDQNPVGETIQIADIPFTVIGVMESKIQLWGYQMSDSFLAWIPAETYIGLALPEYVNYLIVKLNNNVDNVQIQQQIRKIIALNHHLSVDDSHIISIRDSVTVQENTNLLFGGMQIFLGIIGSLTLIVAGVGISNVMFVSVRRNSKEIGVRMALGARSYQVLMHYVIEGLLASLVGGMIGLVVAYGITELINAIPMDAPFAQQIGQPRPVLSFSVVAIVIALLGLIGFFAGFFPARKAANINPVEALRQG